VSPVINGVGLVTNHERVDVCRAIEHGLTLLGHVASPTTYQLRPLNLDSSSAHQDLKLAAQRPARLRRLSSSMISARSRHPGALVWMAFFRPFSQNTAL